MHDKNIEAQALSDFISMRVLTISFLSFLVSLGIVWLLFYVLFENIGDIRTFIPTMFNDIIQSTIKALEEYSILSFILEHKIIMTVFHLLIYFGVGIVVYYLFFMIYAFVISFFNSVLIKYIQEKYYPTIHLYGIGMGATLFFYIKTVLITLMLFMILIPAYFIPAVNILIFLPIYYFFHKTLVFDVSSVINTSQEYQKIKAVNWAELKSKTGFCFVLTLIPIFGILLYPYYILYIGHYMLKESEELRFARK